MEDDAAVEVLVLVVVDGAVVGVAIGNGRRDIEAAVEQLMAVDHGPFVALRHELIHHRAFHAGHVTILDQLFVAERLLELARLELQLVPIMDVQVGVGDRFGNRGPGEIGQQAELVVVGHGGLDAQPRPPDEERIRAARDRAARHVVLAVVEVSTGVKNPRKSVWNLAGDPQLARPVGRLQEEAVVPADEIRGGGPPAGWRAGSCNWTDRQLPDQVAPESQPDCGAVCLQLLHHRLQVLNALLEVRHGRRVGVLGQARGVPATEAARKSPTPINQKRGWKKCEAWFPLVGKTA